MAWISTTIILIILACLLQPWLPKKKLPPGPRGLPIIGSLHLLGKFVHRDLHVLTQRYGPIMHIRLGLVPTIVVSSPHASKLFLKTHDPTFAGRPMPQTSNQMSYGGKDIVFHEYDSYWRNMRKMCSYELLTTPKINSFKSMRKDEVGFLVDRLRNASESRRVVDLSSEVSSLIMDVVCLMVFGKKCGDEEFKSGIHEASRLAGAPNLGDFIPFFAFFDVQGLGRRAKCVTNVFDGFLERIIEEHVEAKDGDKTKDFMDVMLDLMDPSDEVEYRIDRSSIKAIILDLIIGAVDSSSTAINWALSELIKHQHIVKKMQKELENVVGLDRMVEESDLSGLKYLEMVIKETFRMHPPIPLVPRESIEDCNVNGYHIPKKSHIIINEWAIGRDPSTWFDPDKFLPERFIGSQVDMRGRDFQLTPFGSGRRSCPGMQLALIIVRLVIAQLVHCFDWELPNGTLPSELDMTEEFGLTCPRAQNLMVIPIYHLRN